MILYNAINGRVVASLSGKNAILGAGAGELALSGTGGSATHYVDEHDVITEKTAPSFSFNVSSIDADGIDTATITGIPSHTLVTWPDGETTEINDGVLEFAVDLAGTYTFTIDSVAHLIQEVSIEALATA